MDDRCDRSTSTEASIAARRARGDGRRDRRCCRYAISRASSTTDDGVVHAVDDVSFDVVANETLGIVGESGSGKSVTSMAILGLLPKTAKVTGEVRFRRRRTSSASTRRSCEPVRGDQIAMIFQDALAALNPVFRPSGDQIAEAITVHHDAVEGASSTSGCSSCSTSSASRSRAQRAEQYPHEYSGGMRQRAMIAMAIANDPDLLIADEPTTALDVTIQAQVLDVLERIQDRTNSAIMLITHDLGVVAGVADRVMVMYAGRQVELGDVDEIFYEPRHPYTRGLLARCRASTAAYGERAAAPHQGPAAVVDLPAAGLRVPPAVSVRRSARSCA